MSTLASIAGSVFVFLLFASPGLFFLLVGAWRYRMYRRLSRLDGEPPADDMRGAVQAEGRARPRDDALETAPIGGSDVVGYELEIESYMKGGGPDSTGWHEVSHDVVLSKFRLESMTDGVIVDPDAFETSLSNDYEAVVDDPEEIPPELRAYFERDGSVDLAAELGAGLPEVIEHRKLRVRERRIEPGDELIAVGHAEPRAAAAGDDAPGVVVGDPDGSGPRAWLGTLVLLTDRTEPEARQRERRYAWTALGAGALWVAIASFPLVGAVVEAL